MICSLTLLAIIISAATTQGAQVATTPNPSVDEHIRSVIAELPAESALRQQLLNGARGVGLHQPWMDDMRREDIKRALIQVAIHFDRRGRANRMVVNRTEYYGDYADGSPVSDASRLNKIRSSGLEKTLVSLALQRAAHGAWVDILRPKPEPFDGGARVEFLDDEWLPTPTRPLYCAGKSCLSDGKIPQ